MPSPDEIREELKRAGVERASARRRLRKADDELAALLAVAMESPDLTMKDAAELAGIGRTFAYKLVKERS